MNNTLDREFIFNTVREALRIQGKAAVNESSGKCRYRGSNGTKCAVGHLIKKRYYSSYLEGENAAKYDVLKALGLSLGIPSLADVISGEDTEFLLLLQRAHDITLKNRGLEEWEAVMDSIKETHL